MNWIDVVKPYEKKVLDNCKQLYFKSNEKSEISLSK